MKKLESLNMLKDAKLGKDTLSKFHGGANTTVWTERVLGPKTYSYTQDQVGQRAASR